MTVEFVEVGRGKRTWRFQAKARNVDESLATELVRELRKSKALLSRDIDVTLDADRCSGFIFAGVRQVGRWKLSNLSLVHSSPAAGNP